MNQLIITILFMTIEMVTHGQAVLIGLATYCDLVTYIFKFISKEKTSEDINSNQEKSNESI